MDQQIVRVSASPITQQAHSDEQLIALWLHGRSLATNRAYRSDLQRFRASAFKPLQAVTLKDLQDFAGSLQSLSPATQARVLASIKSLFAFAYRLGYLPFDTARVLRLPKLRNNLSQRIISERQTLRLIGDSNPSETAQVRRNRVLLLVLYAGGLRVSELCGLKWRDAQDRSDGEGQLTIFGKGGKTRVVKLPASVWKELLELRAGAADDSPIFRSREGGHLDQSQVNRIVHSAAKDAKLPSEISPHWLRHAHASHAIERGAPIHLVQQTLGHASVATTGRYLHARPTESSSRFLPL
jgi:integrase/recombinase XerD